MYVFSRRFLKNRPALSERGLQELITDNLIKYNYFLTDFCGRNVKSYMKVLVLSNNNPSPEQFLNNSIKHNINIDEYC